MAKEYFNEENRAIYIACESIRSVMVVLAAAKGYVHGSTEATRKIVNSVGTPSDVKSLISRYDWGALFRNQEFLNLLPGAIDYSLQRNGGLTSVLRTIAEYFPEETREYFPTLFLNR